MQSVKGKYAGFNPSASTATMGVNGVVVIPLHSKCLVVCQELGRERICAVSEGLFSPLFGINKDIVTQQKDAEKY